MNLKQTLKKDHIIFSDLPGDLIAIAVKATVQLLYDKRVFVVFDKADDVLKYYLPGDGNEDNEVNEGIGRHRW